MPIKEFQENQQVKSPNESKGTQEMPKKDQFAFNFAMKLWEWSKQARKERETHWDDFDDFYNGKQWKKRPPSYRAAPNINVIRSTIETILPILTDTQPGFDVVPQQPNDYQFSQALSKTVRDWWTRRSMDLTVSDWIKDGLKYDCGIAKVIWNPEIEHGAGDVEVYLPDIRDIWVNDGATAFDKSCQWVIERIYKPLGELRQSFPDKADQIKASGDSKDDKDNEDRTMSGKVTVVSPIDRKAPYGVANNYPHSSSEDDYKTVEVLECWVKDDTTEEYILGNDDDGKEQKELRKKYPNGRVITIIPGLKLVLQDAESPYKDGRFPYVQLVDNRLPRKFYGCGEIEPMMQTQEMLNKSAAVLMDWLNTTTNPCWIVDDQSGVDPNTLTNQVGLVIVKEQGTEVRREQAPPMPPQVFEMYSMWQGLADQISGINDVTQGRRPQGITAAEALQTMQEAAQTRIRLKERNLQVALSRLGELVISRILQYYDEPRVVKVAGEGFAWPEYFEFYIESVDDGNKYQMHKNDFSYNEETEDYAPNGWKSVGQPTSGIFNVQVQGGTALPYLRERRGELALRLRQQGDLDRRGLLETLEWPNTEETLARLEEQDRKAAEAQQMQQPQQ